MTPSSPPLLKPSARRWLWFAAISFGAGVGLVLLFMLTLATRNRVLSEQHFEWLVLVNLGVATVLGAIILWLLLRLGLRFKRQRFGSRLLLKIAGIFALVGLLPGLLIYTVSYQFVARSIESWFDVRVEAALQAGLNLGRRSLDVLGNESLNQARLIAAELAVQSDTSASLGLEDMRRRLGASDLILWRDEGELLASVGNSRFELRPSRPAAEQLRRARENQGIFWLEGLDEEPQPVTTGHTPGRIRVLVPVVPGGYHLPAEVRYLQVELPLSENLVADAMAVQAVNREYQERALAREGLQRMYIGTLTLALFLSVFGAVLLAVLVGNQLLRPLLVLAEGMREVAAGDLSPKRSLPARDELASLTRTFAAMTDDLAEARQAVQVSMSEVSAARASLQTILDNLSSGVLVLDVQGLVHIANPGAERVLGLKPTQMLDHQLTDIPRLRSVAQDWMRRFEYLGQPDGADDHGFWQDTFELGHDAATPEDADLTLLTRGARLPGGHYLLVFDDISEMVSAQRSKAWAEVARRLAHEIKNPLTPIQLSAERLAMKLGGKLQDNDAALLGKSVRTIVDQVDAMKRLVNEFRDYARLPSAELKPLDLNALVRDILGLYDNAAVPVAFEPGADCPWVMADAQQVRQVIHNLVQNAQDACADRPGAVVRLRTRRADSGQWVRLVVSDQGPGFSEHILKRAFEPYVTTKAKGTGLGLAVVRKIMEDHGGRIDLSNRLEDGRVAGAQVSLSFTVA